MEEKSRNQIEREIVVSNFYKQYFEEIQFASGPNSRFHKFHILWNVMQDLAGSGYKIGQIGSFSIGNLQNLAVNEAKSLTERAYLRLVSYIFDEIMALDDEILLKIGVRKAFHEKEAAETDILRGHRAVDDSKKLFLEGELPDAKAFEEAHPDILKPFGEKTEKIS